MPGEGGHMIRAAGGVLWRSSASGAAEVALVHRPRYDDWSLPKGKLRPGEHPLVTACREVAEETRIQATAGKRLDVEHYDTALGPKAVEFWAMRGPDSPFTPTAEVDRLAWMSLPDARWRLRYRRDAYMIGALQALADSVLASSVVLLVRNGRAAPAGRREGGGNDRPLDAQGRGQAEALRLTLPAFGPSRLLSAGGTRFTRTLQPLSAELGLTVETEPVFDEEEYATRPSRGTARILELADAGGASAVCAPGAVIRHLLVTLAEDAGLDVRDYPAVKGSAWALFFSTGRLAAADYYPDFASPGLIGGLADSDQPCQVPRLAIIPREPAAAGSRVPDPSRADSSAPRPSGALRPLSRLPARSGPAVHPSAGTVVSGRCDVVPDRPICHAALLTQGQPSRLAAPGSVQAPGTAGPSGTMGING
jgi:8-oxo-dGTP diphosphatase